MKIFAEQIFFGAIIELVSLIMTYFFKENLRNAIIIFAVGTFVAGYIAFSPPSPPPGGNPVFTPSRTTEAPAVGAPVFTQNVESKPDDWSGVLSVRKPTLNEIRAEKPASLWVESNLNVKDMHKPGMDRYFGSAQKGDEFLLPVYWCATSSDLLAQNVENIRTQFFVNGEVVPEKYVFNYDYDDNTGWRCNYRSVLLGGWTQNTQYIFEVKRTFLKELSDGESSYPAGEYIYNLTVDVR